jgi:hypothetical protein
VPILAIIGLSTGGGEGGLAALIAGFMFALGMSVFAAVTFIVQNAKGRRWLLNVMLPVVLFTAAATMILGNSPTVASLVAATGVLILIGAAIRAAMLARSPPGPTIA